MEEPVPETPEVILKGIPDFDHEAEQATRFGEYVGGGEFEFLGDSSQGVDGIFRPTSSPDQEILVTLKSFHDVEKLGSLLKQVRRNSNKIEASGMMGATLYGEPTHFTADQLADFAENGPLFNHIVQEGMINRIIFMAKDGIVEVTPDAVTLQKGV